MLVVCQRVFDRRVCHSEVTAGRSARRCKLKRVAANSNALLHCNDCTLQSLRVPNRSSKTSLSFASQSLMLCSNTTHCNLGATRQLLVCHSEVPAGRSARPVLTYISWSSLGPLPGRLSRGSSGSRCSSVKPVTAHLRLRHACPELGPKGTHSVRR